MQGNAGLNGRAGFHITDYNEGGTWDEMLDASGTLPQLLRWTARTAKAVLVIYGSHGNTMAVCMPVARHIERRRTARAPRRRCRIT
jgi:hypothetical protein